MAFTTRGEHDMKRKITNHDGLIYLKGNLKKILGTEEIDYIETEDTVLLFPTNISLKRAKSTLKTIQTIFDYKIAKEEEENNETDSEE